jgi:hypothetical protein
VDTVTPAPALPAVRPGTGSVGRLLPWLVLALLGLPVASEVVRHSYVPVDSRVMVQHVDTVLAAIGQGRWSGWNGQFPLLQQLPVFAMRIIGVPDAAVYGALTALSLGAYVGLAALSGWGLRRTPRVAALLVAVLLMGPLAWYAHTTFGEPLAALVTLALVVACAEGAPAPVVFGLALLGGLSKDTAAPFLALLAVAAAMAPTLSAPEAAPSLGRLLRRVPWVPALAGAAAGLAIAAGYNHLEFGTWTNQAYLSPLFLVHDLPTQASFLAANLVSPNGGLFPTWPILLAYTALVLLAAWRRLRHPGAGRLWLLPAGLALLVMAGLLWGFSGWYSPLGWIGWGPRLLLPWVPATCFVLARLLRPELAALLARMLASPALAWGGGLALGLASVPEFVVIFRQSVLDHLFAPDAVCPAIAYVQDGVAQYYRCTEWQLWGKTSILLDAFNPVYGRRLLVAGAACAVGLALLLVWAMLAQPDRGEETGAV